MNNTSVRKKMRLAQYDYASPGAYFITVCTAKRAHLLWREDASCLDGDWRACLSAAGRCVDAAIVQIPAHYPHITVDTYCIMPDHVHLLLHIHADSDAADAQTASAPTVSTVVGQMKRTVSKQLKTPVWQRSFMDSIVRTQRDYDRIWTYIANNPVKRCTGG